MQDESAPDSNYELSGSRGGPSRIEVSRATTKSIGFALIAALLATMIIASIVLATDIILILFLSLLFGVFLCRCAEFVASLVSISRSWSLGLVTFVFLTVLSGGIVLFGFQISRQIDSASKRLDEGATQLVRHARENPTLNGMLSSTPFIKELLPSNTNDKASTKSKLDERTESGNRTSSPPERDQNTVQSEVGNDDASDTTHRSENSEKAGTDIRPIKTAASRAATAVGKVFTSTLGLVVNSLLIFFVGLFLASTPKTYRDGVVRLFPVDRRDRVQDILDKMGESLWSWLIGRFGSMLITGVGATAVLWLLGVPMAISLGIMTGLLAFIPNIGGSIAFLLAFLVAMSQGLSTALWLIPSYVALQLVESYVATPLIQQKQVSIPPALSIAFQAVFGVVFGFLGAAVASPLLAAIKVGVEEAYINDVLGDRDQG